MLSLESLKSRPFETFCFSTYLLTSTAKEGISCTLARKIIVYSLSINQLKKAKYIRFQEF